MKWVVTLFGAGALAFAALSLSGCGKTTSGATEADMKQQLGKQIFFDTGLSSPAGQACSSCHLPSAGFADPDRDLPVSRGIHQDKFGNRNTPTAAYAAFSPEFHFDGVEGLYFGGQFLDGRVASLEQQARAPFLNPLEMANADETSVVEKVSQASYAKLFQQIYGDDIFNDVARAYDSITDALAAFERSDQVSPFSSRFDAWLAGTTELTAAELHGMEIFMRPDKGNCAACHPATSDDPAHPPLFTDFSYDNLGVPANPNNPFLTDHPDFIDTGLGGALAQTTEDGKFKVPTLRNIAKTAPYMHNGVFDNLTEVVNFYNRRDLDGVIAEVASNVNTDELGNLALSPQEVTDLVAFLHTLTDGYSANGE